MGIPVYRRRPQATIAHARGDQVDANAGGTAQSFNAAHRLYESVGFVPTGPFGDYQPDPHSVFMTLEWGGAMDPSRPQEAV